MCIRLSRYSTPHTILLRSPPTPLTHPLPLPRRLCADTRSVQLFWDMQGNDDVEFDPSDYMKAGGELLGLMVLQAWIMCGIWRPEQFKENKLKGLFGYGRESETLSLPTVVLKLFFFITCPAIPS